ncbi:MAG: RnfABCDGE type electron transport complex subunit B [Clostridia bacterium]|jgi:electron transport complex protein RnfB|nr:RnfABCDGE type electron transport complex subunit B [Clostridia bacterium]MDD4146031.1 RnfABCDGE type electron transport complex subunit B [Clostridia bacterium]MDD4665604.1 RnfABCDGE type electron transport complex subunit B [Clostridia bacterium]
MIYAVLSLAVLGALFGIVLGVANKKFAVEVDSRVEAVTKVLPGANCGNCGFPGCSGYAEAIVAGTVSLDACTPGREEVYHKIAAIMGVAVGAAKERKVVQLLCKGGRENAAFLYKYEGVQDCHVAAAMFKGPKVCSYGCLGLGSCVQACPFGGIQMGADQLPVIDYELCSGCGVCVNSCPQHVLKLVEVSHLVHVRCSNKEKGKQAKEACAVACIKCKLCEKNCPEGAISVVADAEGSIAVIDYTKCTNCGICVEKCPTRVIEKMLPLTTSFVQNKDFTAGQPPTGCQHCGLCQ